MRIPSGVTDKYAYFVAYADTGTNPGITRMAGYAAKFTVRRSRDGGASAAFTTPTINETDATNMIGVYELLIDEDTTIAAASLEEEMVVHINDTGGHVRPVTRAIALFRSDTGGIANAVSAKGVAALSDTGINNRLDVILADTDTGIQGGVHVVSIGDTGLGVDVTAVGGNVSTPAHLINFAGEHDTGAIGGGGAGGGLDTGQTNRAVWGADASRTLTHLGALDTGMEGLNLHVASIGDTGLGVDVVSYAGDIAAVTKLVNLVEEHDTGAIGGAGGGGLDTGQTNRAVWGADAARTLTHLGALDTGIAGLSLAVGSISDTGLNNRLDVIAADVDTGIQGGVHVTSFGDTGIEDRLARILADTDTGIQGGVTVVGTVDANLTQVNGDTGIASNLGKMAQENDTGQLDVSASVALDTGQVNQAVWQSDASRGLTQLGALDSGLQGLVYTIHDTGLAALFAAADTGKIADAVKAKMHDTGNIVDGVRTAMVTIADTGAIADAVVTKAESSVLSVNVVQHGGDTGIRDRLGKFAQLLGADGALDTGTGLVRSDLRYVNDTLLQGTGAVADKWRPA